MIWTCGSRILRSMRARRKWSNGGGRKAFPWVCRGRKEAVGATIPGYIGNVPAQMGEQRVCGDLHMEGFYTAAHQKCNARLDLRSGATVSQSKYGIRGTENDFPRLEIRSNENDAEASPVSSLPQDANGVRRSQASKGGASILTLDSPALDTNYKYRTGMSSPQIIRLQ